MRGGNLKFLFSFNKHLVLAKPYMTRKPLKSVKNLFASLLCTLLFDCLGCLSFKASIKRFCLILYRLLLSDNTEVIGYKSLHSLYLANATAIAILLQSTLIMISSSLF